MSGRKGRRQIKVKNRRRFIRIPSIDGFVPPRLFDSKKHSESDSQLFHEISNDFVRSGVIKGDNSQDNLWDESGESFEEMVKSANDGAVFERDYNPDYYDADSDLALDELDKLLGDTHNPNVDY